MKIPGKTDYQPLQPMHVRKKIHTEAVPSPKAVLYLSFNIDGAEFLQVSLEEATTTKKKDILKGQKNHYFPMTIASGFISC